MEGDKYIPVSAFLSVPTTPRLSSGARLSSRTAVTRRHRRRVPAGGARPTAPTATATAQAESGLTAPSVGGDGEENGGVHEASQRDIAQLVSQKVDEQVGGGPLVTFGMLSSNARTAVIGAVAALAGLGGYRAAAPSQQRNVQLVAALGSALVVGGTSTSLSKSGKKVVRKVAASLLAKHAPDFSNLAAQLQDIKERFSVDDGEWRLVMRDLYEMYVMEMVSSTDGEVFYEEVGELILLKKVLGLSGPEVGDAHFEVARGFYRNNVVELEDSESATSEVAQRKLNKLLFLSDRLFTDKELEEAYMYETARIRKHYRMDRDDYDARVASVARPFYEDIVVRTINGDNERSEEELASAQKLLGLSDLDARRIQRQEYGEYVQALVTQKRVLDADDTKTLVQLQNLLDIPANDADRMLETASEPEFRRVVLDVFKEMQQTQEDMLPLYQRLEREKSNLRVPDVLAKEILSSEIHRVLQPTVQSAFKYIRVSNYSSCYSELKKLLAQADDFVKLLSHAKHEETPMDILTEYVSTSMTDSIASFSTQLYSIYLQELLKREGKVNAEERENLARLRVILQLSQLSADDAYRRATGPMYKRQLAGVFASNKFDDASHRQIETVLSDLTLPQDTARSMNLEAYVERLRSYVRDSRILTAEEGRLLERIRAFLGISDEKAMEVHDEECRGVYEQSVSEAMGTTGIISENYREALDKLRQRLFLSPETAEEVYFAVVRGRMKMYALRALENTEKRRQMRGQGEKRDVGDDPFVKRVGAQLGIDSSGLNVELHNLVEFYTRNKLARQREVEYTEESSGEKKTRKVAEYPVTLRDSMDKRTLTDLYKQYLIQCFSAKSRTEKERLFASLDQLGPILGLSQPEINAVHADIGSVIYKNYISQQLLQGKLEEKDSQFLANIQQTLAMSDAQCKEIMAEAKKNRVAVLVEQTLNRVNVVPEMAKKTRDVARELGVSFTRSLQLPLADRVRVFNVEVDSGIESGAINPADQSLIREAKDGWEIPEADARKVLYDNMEKRCSNLLVQAASSVRQGRQETAVNELRTMLRFGRLFPAEVATTVVSDAEKQELLLLYQAFLITDGALSEQAKESLGLLKTLLGIRDAEWGRD